MMDLPYNAETNTTMLSPREKWICYSRDHRGFLRASDLGPRQMKAAEDIYRSIHWEGACYNDRGFVTRSITAEPDATRAAKIYELIDAAWAGIGWAISRKTYKAWLTSMEAIVPVLKTMRPEGEPHL